MKVAVSDAVKAGTLTCGSDADEDAPYAGRMRIHPKRAEKKITPELICCTQLRERVFPRIFPTQKQEDHIVSISLR